MNIISIENKIENGWLITRVYTTDKDWFYDKMMKPVYWDNAKQKEIKPDIWETRQQLTLVNE